VAAAVAVGQALHVPLQQAQSLGALAGAEVLQPEGVQVGVWGCGGGWSLSGMCAAVQLECGNLPALPHGCFRKCRIRVCMCVKSERVAWHGGACLCCMQAAKVKKATQRGYIPCNCIPF